MNGGKVFVDEDDNKKLVDFWEVRHARETDSMVIIDVRNPKERILPGAIKKTVNIPCKYKKKSRIRYCVIFVGIRKYPVTKIYFVYNSM